MQPLTDPALRPSEPFRAPPGRVAFVVDARQGRGRPLLYVAGELDLAISPLLAAMLDDLRQTHPGSSASGGREGSVDVDLRMVTSADSHGLGPLLDSTTTVLAASDRVWRVLHLLQPGVARITQEGPGAPSATSAARSRQRRRADW